MRSRAGMNDSDLGAVAQGGDSPRIVFAEPERVVGALVNGAPAGPVRAKAPNGDWFELTAEPLSELGGVRPARDTLLASELELATPGARRVEIHVDYEVHALRDFARPRGLDFQGLAYGRVSFDQFHGYRILGAHPASASGIEAVAISRPAGRFGNNLMQLVQATHAARELGVTRVYVPALPWFEPSANGTMAAGLTYVGYSDLDDIAVPSLFGTFLFEDLEPAVRRSAESSGSDSSTSTSRAFSGRRLSVSHGRAITLPCTSGRAISSTAPIPIRTSRSPRSRSPRSR